MDKASDLTLVLFAVAAVLALLTPRAAKAESRQPST